MRVADHNRVGNSPLCNLNHRPNGLLNLAHNPANRRPPLRRTFALVTKSPTETPVYRIFNDLLYWTTRTIVRVKRLILAIMAD